MLEIMLQKGGSVAGISKLSCCRRWVTEESLGAPLWAEGGARVMWQRRILAQERTCVPETIERT